MSSVKHTISSGNVFEDLGLPDADERRAKANLALQISELIDAQKLTQVQAAQRLGVDQPKVSALVRGNLSGFSMERLFRFIVILGRDVEISIHDRMSSTDRGRLHVIAPQPPGDPLH